MKENKQEEWEAAHITSYVQTVLIQAIQQRTKEALTTKIVLKTPSRVSWLRYGAGITLYGNNMN
jgi:hypothetical protein